jgi:RNA polymerase sigma-70 factor (ECF subfamily)
VTVLRLQAVTLPRQPSRRDASAHPILGHADALYDLAWHLARNRSEAEDLVQEAFSRALRSWSQFQAGTNLKAWLLRILRNAWLDRIRHHRHDPVDRSVGESDEGPAPPDGEDGWLRGDAELERMRGLVAGEIDEAMGALREEQRTAILLDLEGLTEAEMASILGCAPGTVKSRLSRARAVLRTRLADYRR